MPSRYLSGTYETDVPGTKCLSSDGASPNYSDPDPEANTEPNPNIQLYNDSGPRTSLIGYNYIGYNYIGYNYIGYKYIGYNKFNPCIEHNYFLTEAETRHVNPLPTA